MTILSIHWSPCRRFTRPRACSTARSHARTAGQRDCDAVHNPSPLDAPLGLLGTSLLLAVLADTALARARRQISVVAWALPSFTAASNAA